ncbi:MAG: Eco57I restriction-modification methylase domain-containing protein, partial [Nanoarchaeota archaeon]|nr:Eco57I restriction-modification methylase domain-containing protein [Nanoarchaeota archaeon]
KAVELAQLNLMLKLLEEETRETRDRILPLMRHNIKCGNSLIDDSKVAGDKAFNWKAQFPDVFSDGGFDIVVGNPPWGAKISREESDFFVGRYIIQKKNLNTFDLFVRNSISILKEKGFFGFVIPKNSIKSNDYTSMRKYVLENTELKNLDIFGIFEGVTQEFVTLIFEKSGANIGEKNKNTIQINQKTKISQEKFYNNTNFIFNPKLDKFASIFNRIEDGEKLGDLIFIKRGEEISKKGEIFQCFYCKKWFPASKQENKNCSNCNKNLLLSKCNKYELVSRNKDEFHKIPIITGEDINTYYININHYFDTKKEGISYKEEEMYSGERLLMNKIASTFKVGLIIEKGYSTQNVYTIKSLELKCNLKFLLALFNSTLWRFYYENKFNLGAKITTAISLKNIRELNFPHTSKSQEQKIISLVDRMLELQKKVHSEGVSGNEKEQLEQQIKNVDYEIDEEVYKLYGITDEEKRVIGVVENGL